MHAQNLDDLYREIIEGYNNGLEDNDGAIDLCNKQSQANWNVQTNVGVDQYVTEQVKKI